MKIISIICCVVFSLFTHATSFVKGAYTFVVLDGKMEVKIYKAKNLTGNVELPSTVYHNGTMYKVTEVGPAAFENLQFTSLSIPATYLNIGDNAFYGCSSLKEVIIEDAVEQIFLSSMSYKMASTFNGCPIAKVTIGRPVYASSYTAFGGCPIEELIVRGNLRAIPDKLGVGNSHLTKLDICSSVEEIPGSCFSGSTALETLHLPNVRYIGNYAFSGCSSLIEITGLNYLKFVGDYAFSDCSNLERIDFSSVIMISDRAFNKCISLQNFEIPNCSKIGACAFYGCTSLTRISYPEGFSQIADGAFFHCDNILEIVFPSTLQFVGDDYSVNGSFGDCDKLKKIVCKALIPPVVKDTYAFPYNSFSNAELVVPTNTKVLYKEAEIWKKFTKISEMDFSSTNVEDIIECNGKCKLIDNVDLGGRKHKTPQQGINIVRYINGTSKKIFIP